MRRDRPSRTEANLLSPPVPRVAALYVEAGGAYWDLEGVDPWDKERDARRYAGPYPIVAHPPCQLWGKFAPINFKRWGGEHNRPGNDGGCFAAALGAVRAWGGVLEHPALTKAWPAHGLARPVGIGWHLADVGGAAGPGWVCEVWQRAYGHRAQKRTWLYAVGQRPPELDWRREPGEAWIGYRNKNPNQKPTVTAREACATPPAFRDALLDIARKSRP
jgi:hypothetical protein